MANKIRSLQKAINYLIYKELDDIDLSIEMGHAIVRTHTTPSRITHEQSMKLKRVFGPLKPGPDYGYEHRDLHGSVKLDDELSIEFKLAMAMSCEKYDPEELTEEKWDEIREAVKRGEISIPNCKPQPYKEDF